MSCCNTSPCACVNLGESEQAPVIYTTTPLTYVENIAALKALRVTGRVTGFPVEVLGYWEAGDEGGGIFIYDEDSVAATNLGYIFAPDSGSGRWIRAEDKVMTIKQWGAYGNYNSSLGTGADDSMRIAAAFSWWKDNPGVTLQIPPGDYQIASTVRTSFTANTANLGLIEGLGGRFYCTIPLIAGTGTIEITPDTNYGTVTGVGTSFVAQLQEGYHIKVASRDYTVLSIVSNTEARIYENDVTVGAGTSFEIAPPMISFFAQANVRRAVFRGIKVVSGTAYSAGALFQILGRNGTTQNWDGFVVDTFNGSGAICTSLELGRGVFEGTISNIEVGAIETSATHPIVKVMDTYGTGDSSSIFFYNPNIRGGRIGIYSTIGDIYIYGGTAINAQREGLRMRNFSGQISGFHVENNWLGAGSLADGQSGIFVEVSRPATVSSVYGVNASGYQKHAVGTYCISDLNLIGCSMSGSSGTESAHYIQGLATGTVNIVGGGNTLPTTVPVALQRFRALRTEPNLLQLRQNFYTMGATVTPNLSQGSLVDIATITGPFTIANPTGITPAIGMRLAIYLRAEATGGYAITFGSDYSTVSALSTTINKQTNIEFQYGANSKWNELYRSATF